MDLLRYFSLLLLWIIYINLGSCQTDAPEQIQIPIGAYRIFPKTSFSCFGRPAGYYADVETGCQVYHMCDGLGRQFSYSCPNTTLFQQRMLICDHWYMVNCSRAESDYAANLLIGQRDKPFVPEEENHLRTPRPDLLDRPYAPDYSGESFRNQYKQFPSVQNQIIDFNSEKFNKPSSTRWRIQRPSPEILPPSPPVINRRNDYVDDISKNRKNDHVDDISKNRRNDDADEISSDLGTSFSSNYNTSADISIEEAISEKPTDSNIIVSSIKTPSRLYEPPFLYPIWNENYTDTEKQSSPQATESTTPFKATTTIPTTFQSFSRPSTFAGRPFSPVFITSTSPLPPTISVQTETEDNLNEPEASPLKKTVHSDYDFSKYSNQPITEIQDKDATSHIEESQQTSTTNDGFSTTSISTTTGSSVDDVKSDFELNVPREDQLLQPSPFSVKSSSEISQPSILILPPFSEYVTHDIATTQGPPIYYEWKIPSNALEPPKLDSPIGVNGRKEDDYPPENDSLSTATSFVDSAASNQPRPFSHNPFLSPIVNKSQRSVTTSSKTPTPRSVQQNPAQSNSLIDDTKETNKSFSNNQPTEADIEQLRKDFHVPDYLFPLENDGRTGYEHAGTVNSFQIKIPDKQNNTKRWYGENPDCPECHPSFVKPGTCEPCVRRR